MEIVTLDDDREYVEVSVSELEAVRLEREIERQVKTGRASRTKHDVFLQPADTHVGKKSIR